MDRAVKPILDRGEVYSGCYARVSLNFYAFNSNGNKGIAHVHDEVIIEADSRMSLDVVCEQMARVPKWAAGLLLRADGYTCEFYKKD